MRVDFGILCTAITMDGALFITLGIKIRIKRGTTKGSMSLTTPHIRITGEHPSEFLQLSRIWTWVPLWVCVVHNNDKRNSISSTAIGDSDFLAECSL